MKQTPQKNHNSRERSKQLATLSSPNLSIKLISGTNNAEVTATVASAFSAFEKALVDNLGLKFRLKCKLRGQDSGFNGADDDLFSFASKQITANGTSTFKTTVSRDTIDEDWEGNDEVYARFTLQSTEPIFPFATSKDSSVITGNF
jgi:hypothetical protein